MQYEQLNKQEILINKQEHDISKRQALLKKAQEIESDNEKKEELIRELKRNVQSTEFTLKNSEEENQEQELIFKQRIDDLTHQLQDITEKDDLPQLLQMFYDETQKDISFIENKMLNSEMNKEKISKKQKTINKLKQELDKKREQLNSQITSNISLVKTYGEQASSLRSTQQQEISKIKSKHEEEMKAQNEESERLIEASQEKNKEIVSNTLNKTEFSFEELQLQLEQQTKQFEQEKRLKENYNQENIWLKFLNDSLNQDISHIGEEIKKLEKDCNEKQANIQELNNNLN